MKTHEASRFSALNRMVEAVAHRDLNLLNAIDETIDSLCSTRAEMDILTDALFREIDRLKELGAPIDQEGKFLPMFENGRDAIGEFYRTMEAKCNAARNAPELRADDGVVEAYCELLGSTAKLHNAINDLCWTIGEHDADFDKATGKMHTSTEQMFADLEA